MNVQDTNNLLLSPFMERYAAADEKSFTDLFSTREISLMLYEGTGASEVDATTIEQILKEKGYSGTFTGSGFFWRVAATHP